jgi:hypothetical protein
VLGPVTSGPATVGAVCVGAFHLYCHRSLRLLLAKLSVVEDDADGGEEVPAAEGGPLELPTMRCVLSTCCCTVRVYLITSSKLLSMELLSSQLLEMEPKWNWSTGK